MSFISQRIRAGLGLILMGFYWDSLISQRIPKPGEKKLQILIKHFVVYFLAILNFWDFRGVAVGNTSFGQRNPLAGAPGHSDSSLES